MHYLVYISSAAHPFDEAELRDILEKSRENNLTLGITGILIYMDGNIIQLLEGEEAHVRQVYKKIEEDPRHRGLMKLKEGAQDSRNFPDWSMGFKSVSAEDYEKIIGHKKIVNFDFYQSLPANSSHPAMVILKTFIKNNRF